MASDLVKSNIVSMDWEKIGWYKVNGVFYVASKEYVNENGDTIAVFFTPEETFLWADNAGTTVADLWTIKDLIPWLHQNAGADFPHAYNEFMPILNGDGSPVSDRMSRFGLDKFLDDILERSEDIGKFGIQRSKPVGF